MIHKALASVLIVDDDAIVAALLEKNLLRVPYDVTVANSGQDALAAIAAIDFDLVLLDVDMPGMTGHQVLAQIKSSPRLKHIPVMMLTGAMNTDSILKCKQLGASEYILKPYSLAMVKARMAALLGEH